MLLDALHSVKCNERNNIQKRIDVYTNLLISRLQQYCSPYSPQQYFDSSENPRIGQRNRL